MGHSYGGYSTLSIVVAVAPLQGRDGERQHVEPHLDVRRVPERRVGRHRVSREGPGRHGGYAVERTRPLRRELAVLLPRPRADAGAARARRARRSGERRSRRSLGCAASASPSSSRSTKGNSTGRARGDSSIRWTTGSGCSDGSAGISEEGSDLVARDRRPSRGGGCKHEPPGAGAGGRRRETSDRCRGERPAGRGSAAADLAAGFGPDALHARALLRAAEDDHPLDEDGREAGDRGVAAQLRRLGAALARQDEARLPQGRRGLDPAARRVRCAERNVAALDLSLGKAYDDRRVFCWPRTARRSTSRSGRSVPRSRSRPRASRLRSIRSRTPSARSSRDRSPRRRHGESRLESAKVDADIRISIWDPRASELHIAGRPAWGYNEKEGSVGDSRARPEDRENPRGPPNRRGEPGLRSHFSPDGRWVATLMTRRTSIYDFRNTWYPRYAERRSRRPWRRAARRR